MKKLIFAALVIYLAFTANVFAEEFSADVITVMAGMTLSSKVYNRDFKTSRTEANGTVLIQIGENLYQIFENTKKYFVVETEELKQMNPMADADDFEEFVAKNNMKKVGSESVSGYKCDVYEGNITYEEAKAPMAMKLWYSPQLDYNIKTETQHPAPMSGTAVHTLVNIKSGKQPDSLFEIPAGYTQVQSIMEVQSIMRATTERGGFSGGESGRMPSQEDMEKMSQMMPEMMGNGQN